MKKKIALVLASLLTSSAMASLSSTTYIADPERATVNQWAFIYSKHDWSVSNDSAVTQTVSICYTTSSCTPNTINYRTQTDCEQVTLGSMITKAGSYTQHIQTSYAAPGWCDTHASTTITGWQTQTSTRDGKLIVSS